MASNGQAVDLFRALELAGNPELESSVAHADGSAGYVLIFLGDDALESDDGETVVGQLVRVGFDPDLPLQSTGHLGLQNPGDGLDILRQVFGDLLEPDQASGS